MHGKPVARKTASVPFGTSVRYANGAVVTTFDPPPKGFDPMTADQATLRNHGYPFRPAGGAALARWKDLLGKPMQSVKPTIRRIPHPPRVLLRGVEVSGNWSGAAVFGKAPATLFTASARWKIPTFKKFATGNEQHASIWVGLDGIDSNDVFQAGVHATMQAQDQHPEIHAWFEWFPDDENAIDLTVSSGDTMSCVVTVDQDCLPGFTVQQGQWDSIDDGHQLIPMHDGKVLDWVKDTGSWRLWNYDPGSAKCLTGPVSHGRWSSVRDGHVLVPMHDGKVLDWVPDDGSWRLWNYVPSNHDDCLPVPFVSHGKWKTVHDGHVLVPMKDGKVIDWVPDDGTWRLWNYVPSNLQDCLPANAVSTGRWTSLDDDHTLVPMHDGRVLDWQGDGTFRLWNYDPAGHSMVAGTLVLRNETRNRHVSTHMQAPDGTHLRGNCAEWVVERPAENHVVQKLLDYGKVTFTSAHAEKSGGQVVKASQGDTIVMSEDGKTVSVGTASGETVTCTFV